MGWWGFLFTEYIVYNDHRLVPTQVVLSAYFYHNLLCNGSFMACLFLLTTSIYLDYSLLPVIPELDVVLEGQELEDRVDDRHHKREHQQVDVRLQEGLKKSIQNPSITLSIKLFIMCITS